MFPHIMSGSAEGGLIFWVLPITAALIVAIGIRNLRRVTALRSNGVRVPGRITGAQSGSRPGVSAATFEFMTADGRYVHTSQQMGSTMNLLQPGREVTVAYDEHDPENAEVIESVSQPVGAVAFIAVGAVFLLPAYVVLS